jgi:hypothetical protein
MTELPPYIIELSRIVVEKCKGRFGSAAGSWKLVDAKTAEDKWKEEGRDKNWIEEQVEHDPASVYWFRYEDKQGRSHEFKIRDRKGPDGAPNPAILRWGTDDLAC